MVIWFTFIPFESQIWQLMSAPIHSCVLQAHRTFQLNDSKIHFAVRLITAGQRAWEVIF